MRNITQTSTPIKELLPSMTSVLRGVFTPNKKPRVYWERLFDLGQPPLSHIVLTELRHSTKAHADDLKGKGRFLGATQVVAGSWFFIGLFNLSYPMPSGAELGLPYGAALFCISLLLQWLNTQYLSLIQSIQEGLEPYPNPLNDPTNRDQPPAFYAYLSELRRISRQPCRAEMEHLQQATAMRPLK